MGTIAMKTMSMKMTRTTRITSMMVWRMTRIMMMNMMRITMGGGG